MIRREGRGPARGGVRPAGEERLCSTGVRWNTGLPAPQLLFGTARNRAALLYFHQSDPRAEVVKLADTPS